ncbi:hypothetical protein M9Y10_031889 [Tritrichomonas musculus]|uniref:Uncharacterized protein n=1 Tax=Tritrichomonas musculus TaxID=1915356 RepID=A0ABR2H042_9EUKA
MDKSSSVPLINLSHQGSKGSNQNKDHPEKKKISIPSIPVIPTIGIKNNQQNEIPKISFPTLPKSEGGFPNIDIPLSAVPELNLNLSTMSLPEGKEKIYDKKPVTICIPFIQDSIDSDPSKKLLPSDQTISKKIVTFFGGQADFTEIYMNTINNPPITVVEYNNDIPSLIPSFQMIDSAYQEIKHLPQMIDRVNNESSSVFGMIEEMMNEIEKLKAQKEELTVKNAVMKEKIRSGREEADRFNESAMRMKNSFDEFLKKIPQT